MTPDGWTSAALAQLVSIRMETVSTAEMSKHSNLTLYSIPAFDAGREPERPVGSAVGSNKYRVPADCVLLSRLNPRIPRVWRIAGKPDPFAVCSTEFWPLESLDGRLDLDYLASFLRSSLFLENPRIQPAATTKSHQRIQIHGFQRFELPLPPLSEQRKIAAILSSVDDVIQKTEAVIEQLQVVKEAMVQELFTRGLPGRHTRFKQTAVGEVPVDWAVAPFEDVVTIGPQNGLYKPSEYYGSGTPMFDMGDLFRSEIIQQRDRRRVRLTNEERAKFLLAPGDLVFARRSLVAEGSGKCALAPVMSEYPVFESSMIRMRPDPSRCDPLFLLHYWNGPFGQRLRMGITRQVAVSGITGKDLAAQPVILPPVDEQRRISRAIESVDSRVAQEVRSRELLQIGKLALTSVLLTGDVRVMPDKAAA